MNASLVAVVAVLMGAAAGDPLTEASVRVREFDLKGAEALLTTAAKTGGVDTQIAALYVRGLLDARDAFQSGGSPETIAPVYAAITSLGNISRGLPGPAEIARLFLYAAAAAAQSERDEMRLYLDTALRLESVQQEAGQTGAPVVSATEAAGDLWLRVHQYEEAQKAYKRAVDRLGPTPQILYGLARSARGLKDGATACATYRALVETWGTRPGIPAEITEAHTYLRDCKEGL